MVSLLEVFHDEHLFHVVRAAGGVAPEEEESSLSFVEKALLCCESLPTVLVKATTI